MLPPVLSDPLPWREVNNATCASVAAVLGLKRADRRGGFTCPVCNGLRLTPLRKGGRGGWKCWSGCNSALYQHVDLAAAVWHCEPWEALRRLAPELGLAHLLPAEHSRQDSGRDGTRGPRIVKRTRNPTPPAFRPQNANAGHGSDRAARIAREYAAIRADGMQPAAAADVYAAILTQGRLLRTAADRDALEAVLLDSYLPVELEHAGLWESAADDGAGRVALPACALPALLGMLAGDNSTPARLTLTPLGPSA